MEQQDNKVIKDLKEASKNEKSEAVKAAIDKKIKQIKKPFTK